MAQYKSFLDAWNAKNAPKPTPAQTTWTPQNLQRLANAYSGGYTNPVTGDVSGGNPTWTPPAEMNAALPNPIKPVVFDPYNDVGYAAGASAAQNANQHAQAEYGYTDENGVFHPGYQTHRGAQAYGYDQSGNLITGGPDLNPYAQAAIMKKNYEDAQRGTTNSYAASGQLYAGSLNNAQQANDYGYGQRSDQLQRQAADFFHNNVNALQGVKDSGNAQLAALLGPAFTNFLARQGTY